jgi:thiol-disulfide isomerase/thioredoxin
MTDTPNEGSNGVRPEYMIGIAIILSAALLALVLYIGLNGISTSVGKVAYAATLAPTASLSGASGTQKEVTMDFLYADWCAHCQKMKPIVEKLVAELPSDRFQVNYWSDADYQAGKPGTVAVFDKYSNNGMFLGYPTFVINGAVNASGEIDEAQFKSWVCSQFTSPAPSACG